jgi:hypothetical protein
MSADPSLTSRDERALSAVLCYGEQGGNPADGDLKLWARNRTGKEMNKYDYWLEFSLGFIMGMIFLMIFYPVILLWVMG